MGTLNLNLGIEMKISYLGVAALATLLLFPAQKSYAIFISCSNGAPATITGGDCTVTPSLVPTTVNFNSGATGKLILNGASPTGAVTTSSKGTGIVSVVSTSTTQSSIGSNYQHINGLEIAGGGVTFNLGHDLEANLITVGANSRLNQTAGMIETLENYTDLTPIHLNSGSVFNQTGDASFKGSLKFLGEATAYIKNQGLLASEPYWGKPTGTLYFTGTYDNYFWGLGGLGGHIYKLVQINDGATFTMSETSGAQNFIVGEGNSGRLIVPNSTTRLNAHFTLNANATLQVPITGSGQNNSGSLELYDTLELYSQVATDVFISPDSILDIRVDNGVSLVEGTTYTLVDGQIGNYNLSDLSVNDISAPTTVLDDSDDFNFEALVSAAGDDLLVQVVAASLLPRGFRGGSRNLNQVISVIEEALGDDPEIATALKGISTFKELRKALESLLPNPNGAIIIASFAAHDFAVNTIRQRLANLRRGNSMGSGLSAGDQARDTGYWVQAFGSDIDQGDRGGVAGFDAETKGVTFGVDTKYRSDIRLGAAFSYSATDADTNSSSNNTDADSYQLSLYASKDDGPWFYDATASYAKNKYDSARFITIGALTRIASADFDADQFGLEGTVGREYQYGEDTFLTPYLNVRWARLDVDGFTEEGAGAANQVVKGNDYDALESTLGVSLHKEIMTRSGSTMVPEVHVAWKHEYLDDDLSITSAFTGGGASFATEGLDPADDGLNIGASLTVRSKDNLDFKVTYDYEGRSDFDSHSATATLRYNFY